MATVNSLTSRASLTFPAESVTVTVQFEYVPSLRESKVIVLFPWFAVVVLEEQEPPYAMVPAILEQIKSMKKHQVVCPIIMNNPGFRSTSIKNKY